jgi:hypothetical protein
MIDVKKLPVAVRQAVRESFGANFDDPRMDAKIAELYPAQILERYFRQNRLDMTQNYARVYEAAVGIAQAVKNRPQAA